MEAQTGPHRGSSRRPAMAEYPGAPPRQTAVLLASLWSDLFYPTIPGKYQLNLWEANRQIMLEAGILAEHIEVTDICTCCNPDFLFSHRASQGKRGNLGAFLALI